MTSPSRRGFTVAEMLVVTVLLGLILAGLFQAHIQQRRYSEWQRRVADVHDGFRVASALFSAELREAAIGEGDVVVLAPDSIAVRSPLGFALVCATRASPPLLAFQDVVGVMPGLSADSMLVHTDAGWRAVGFVRSRSPGGLGIRCANSGALPSFVAEVGTGVPDLVPVGAPVRVFRRHRYHEVIDAGSPWLARTDPTGTDPLIGPLSTDGLRFRLLDASGVATVRPSEAVATELRLVVERVGVGRAAVRDTLTVVFQGRNR